MKGRNFIWDLHAVVGTWVVIFYLILACTGLYWSYDWWRDGMFKVLVLNAHKPQMQEGPRPNAGANSRPTWRTGWCSWWQSHVSKVVAAHKVRHTARGERGRGKQHGERKGLSPEQVQIALTQTWTGFNAQDWSGLFNPNPKYSEKA